MASNGATTPTKSKSKTKVFSTAHSTAGPSSIANNFKNLTINTSGDASKTQANGQSARKPGWMGPNPISSSEHPFHPDDEGVSPTSAKLHGSAIVFQPGMNATTTSSKPTPMSMLNRGSVVDAAAGLPTIVESHSIATRSSSSVNKGKEPITDIAPVGTRSGEVMPVPTEVRFSTDCNHDGLWLGTHFLRIDKIAAAEYEANMRSLHLEFGWNDKIVGQKVPQQSASKKNITLYLCFNDIRDCQAALDDISLVNQNWIGSFSNQAEYAAVAAGTSLGSRDETSPFDGQVKLQAIFEGDLKDMAAGEIETVENTVFELAEHYGEVLAFKNTPSSNSHTLEYRVEFYKYSDAKELIDCVTTAQPHSFDDWKVVASKIFLPVMPVYQMSGADMPQIPSTPQKYVMTGHDQWCSPSGRTAWSYDSNGEPIVRQAPYHVPKAAGMRNQYYMTPGHRDRYDSAPVEMTPSAYDEHAMARCASYPGGSVNPADGEPQVVKLPRIENGQDVRTTIMLRNMPNKWTCHDMKRVLDYTSKGKYDFSYLRIDFSWNTNVGYAFVNFTDPIHIVGFAKYWVGREWDPHMRGPRKVAAVSYATIQGYDCLVEKFRNSAIMDEFPGFRPKLWHTDESTSDLAEIGTERVFPPPNNLSKKQRSADNAGQIGLFAPRSGQRTDRMRRSNYDRGTPRQIQEDAVYHNQYTPYGYGQPVQPPIGAPAMYSPPYYGHFPGYPAGPMGYGDGFAMYGPPPFFGGFPAYGPPAPNYGYGNGYTPVNPASNLRTISNGRLAGRPRHVTVMPGNEDLFGGSSRNNSNTVPRSFGGVNGQHYAHSSGDYASNGHAYADSNGATYPHF